MGGNRSGGDGSQVEFAAGQVDHRGEVLHAAEAPGTGLDVLDDAVESFEDRVGAPVVEVARMSCQWRRNWLARVFMGSRRDLIIHEHSRLTPVSASTRSALVS